MTENSIIATHALANEVLQDPIEVSPEEFSTNFYWTCGKVEIFNLQTTVRGNPNPREILEHLESVKASLTVVVRTMEGHAKQVGKQPDSFAPPIVTSDAERAQASGKGNALPVPPPPVPSGAQTNSPRGEAQCIAIEVGKTYTGDKTQLKFVCKGMEHPLTYAKSEADMVKLLAPLGFTAAHIVRGEKYQANAVIVWEQGEKYKNVVSVRPAA